MPLRPNSKKKEEGIKKEEIRFNKFNREDIEILLRRLNSLGMGYPITQEDSFVFNKCPFYENQ